MKYHQFESAFSAARLSKYKNACGGNTVKALTLYRYNVRLCQKFYGVLSIFEIVLRNAINKHFSSHFNDADWIYHQLQNGGMLAKANTHQIRWFHLSVSVFGHICSPKCHSVLETSRFCRYSQPARQDSVKRQFSRSFSK